MSVKSISSAGLRPILKIHDQDLSHLNSRMMKIFTFGMIGAYSSFTLLQKHNFFPSEKNFVICIIFWTTFVYLSMEYLESKASKKVVKIQ